MLASESGFAVESDSLTSSGPTQSAGRVRRQQSRRSSSSSIQATEKSTVAYLANILSRHGEPSIPPGKKRTVRPGFRTKYQITLHKVNLLKQLAISQARLICVVLCHRVCMV